MVYVDIEFPPRIAMGALRKAGWSTNVVQTISGYESTNQNWSRARHSFDISFAVRTADDYQAVVNHFHSVRGRAKSFPLKDPLDYQATGTEGVLLDDAGSPSLGYHLAKQYGTGADAYYRRITRPVSGTIKIYRDRGGVISEVTSSATISYTTGWVTFSGGTLQAGDAMNWVGEFRVPVRYDVDELPATIVNREPGGGELLVQCDSIQIVEVREA